MAAPTAEPWKLRCEKVAIEALWGRTGDHARFSCI